MYIKSELGRTNSNITTTVSDQFCEPFHVPPCTKYFVISSPLLLSSLLFLSLPLFLSDHFVIPPPHPTLSLTSPILSLTSPHPLSHLTPPHPLSYLHLWHWYTFSPQVPHTPGWAGTDAWHRGHCNISDPPWAQRHRDEKIGFGLINL